MRLIALVIPAALAGCSTTPEQAGRAAAAEAAARTNLEAELAGLTPGEPTSCLPTVGRTQVSTKGYGATIVYRISDKLKYRTDTSGGCEGIARGDILVTTTPIGRVCSGDIAQTIDRVARFPTGSCSFGPFVPYRRAS